MIRPGKLVDGVQVVHGGETEAAQERFPTPAATRGRDPMRVADAPAAS